MQVYDGERYYHRIPGLLVPRLALDNDIVTNINKFIDTIPGVAAMLEEHAANMEEESVRNYFINIMGSLIELLKSIHARGLETDAARILRWVQDATMLAFAKRSLKPFVTDILSLSVAMQKAQNNDKLKKTETLSKIEIFNNLAKNIATVSNLIEDEYYELARELLVDLLDHTPDAPVLKVLLDLITASKYDEAKAQIGTLNEKFNETLDRLAGTDMSKKILAVDDMPEILSFVNNALKSHYKVIAVPGGKPALKVMESQKPDLFILDIDMPGMDGYELATRIREMPEHAKTPIIFLTGNSTREHISRATEVGGDEFIVKPATHGYLLTKVGGFLNA